jgi:hypothetical protein
MKRDYSVSPDGEGFPLPTQDEYAGEFRRLRERVSQELEKGREIVLVVGLGFVGAVTAAVVADSTDASGNPSEFVIGMERRFLASAWFRVQGLTLSFAAIWHRKELIVGSAPQLGNDHRTRNEPVESLSSAEGCGRDSLE